MCILENHIWACFLVFLLILITLYFPYVSSFFSYECYLNKQSLTEFCKRVVTFSQIHNWSESIAKHPGKRVIFWKTELHEKRPDWEIHIHKGVWLWCWLNFRIILDIVFICISKEGIKDLRIRTFIMVLFVKMFSKVLYLRLSEWGEFFILYENKAVQLFLGSWWTNAPEVIFMKKCVSKCRFGVNF